jgi:galactosyl transferase GMA12/MNN10 family
VSDRALASLGTGAQERLLRLASRSFAPYARRHGYDLHLHSKIVAPERPAPWSKIPILRDLVERYALVVWIDADAVIVDQRADIACELRADAFLYLVEHTVRGEPRPNTGVMLLRGGKRAAAFLDAVWELAEYAEHRWWENAAVCELLGYSVDPPARLASTPWRDATRFMSRRWNWIFDAPVKRARIRHFPGFSLRTRELLMSGALTESRVRALGSSSSSARH